VRAEGTAKKASKTTTSIPAPCTGKYAPYTKAHKKYDDAFEDFHYGE